MLVAAGDRLFATENTGDTEFMRMVDSSHLYSFTGRVFAAPRFLVLLLWALCALSGESLAQDFRRVHPGVEYAQVEHKIGGDPVKINLLRLDRLKVKLDVVHAADKAIGLETTSSIAKRRKAVAAINSGFFRLDKSAFAGDASGVLMIDQVLLSESNLDRTAVFIADYPATNLGIGQIRTRLTLDWNGRNISASGLNRERKADEIVAYSSAFGPSTMTSGPGIELTLLKDRIASVNKGNANTVIPDGGWVISASGLAASQFAEAQIGDRMEFRAAPMLSANGNWLPLEYVDDIVAGVSRLISGGKIDLSWEREKAAKAFAETRHPRTAVAKLKDGKFLMVTVDGRQPGVSVGMSLQELAEYLLSLGAVDAMNLDGGGSTTMYLDGKVVNTPSDKEGERKIGDAIVVTLRK